MRTPRGCLTAAGRVGPANRLCLQSNRTDGSSVAVSAVGRDEKVGGLDEAVTAEREVIDDSRGYVPGRPLV